MAKPVIFLSRATEDEVWRQRFVETATPFQKANEIEFWWDHQIGSGPYDPQIHAAMERSCAVVYFVSAAYLASKYITETELPFFEKARKAERLKVFWFLLEPCDWQRFPSISPMQAVTLGTLKPLCAMSLEEWRATMLHGVAMIESEIVYPLERPQINLELDGQAFQRVVKDLELLEEPAKRDTVVMVYSSDGRWWRQLGVRVGSKVTDITLGSENTKSGTEFQVVALTTDEPLPEKHYPSLPKYRTCSTIIKLRRE